MHKKFFLLLLVVVIPNCFAGEIKICDDIIYKNEKHRLSADIARRTERRNKNLATGIIMGAISLPLVYYVSSLSKTLSPEEMKKLLSPWMEVILASLWTGSIMSFVNAHDDHGKISKDKRDFKKLDKLTIKSIV